MSALEAENKRLPKPRQRELDASSRRSRDGVILTSGVCVFSHIVSASRRGAGVGWFRGAGLGAQVSVPVRHPRAACRPCGQVYDGMAPRLYVLQKHAEQVQLTAIPRRGFNTLLSMTEAFGVQSPSPFQMRRAVQFPVAVLHVTPVTHSLCYRFVASDLRSVHARPPSAPAVTRLFPWP